MNRLRLSFQIAMLTEGVRTSLILPVLLSARVDRGRLLMVDCRISPDQRRSNHHDLVTLYARRMSLLAATGKFPPEVHDPWSEIELVQFGRPMPESLPEPAGDVTEPNEFVIPPELTFVKPASPLDRGRELLQRVARFLSFERSVPRRHS
jgi:hypothetical protein